jgi:sugar phosphate isomerase/epimerase
MVRRGRRFGGGRPQLISRLSAPHQRLGCSTITFRHRSPPEALQNISELGFRERDFGASALGSVDFPDLIASLAEKGYRGQFALELETRDVPESDRPAATARASDYIADLMSAVYA